MEDLKFDEFKIKDITEYPPSFSPKKSNDRKHFINYLIIFIIILIIFAGGLYLWDNYLSPSARKAREAQENYQKYLDWQKDYEDAMRADTYGGKTPQETLDMFVDALKKGDMDLASKYFILEDDGKTNPKWLNSLIKAKEEGKIELIISIFERAEPAGSITEEYYGFEVRDSQNKLVQDIGMKLNTFSNVWKIENL